jgi:hypothetical protein
MDKKASSSREKGSFMKKRDPGESLGARLLRALTDEELAALLDALFEPLDAKGLATLASRVDSGTTAILTGFHDGDSKKQKPIATRAKCEREWESAWERWREVIAELGEEEGRYVDQEHHWEAPYFAGDVFAESLDEVAKNMLPLIDRVPWLWTEEKDLFRDALLEIKEGVDSYPEWMGEGECDLGPVLTTCFLKWEWCASSTKENGTLELLERIRGTEDALMAISFDNEAFVEFFTSLPRGSQREIHDAMRKLGATAQWQNRLSSSRSKWHRVQNALLAHFDTKGYLEDCMVQLDDEWSYGLPLIEHLVKKHDLASADEVVKKTFASLLSFEYQDDKAWVPEEELILERLGYHSPSPDARIMKLLASATAIARERGNADRAAVLDLQKLMYRDAYRWDDISGAFRKFLVSSIGKPARILLSRWENMMAESSFGPLDGEGIDFDDTWVSWLIEAGIDEAKGRAWFPTKVVQWLALLEGNSKRFKRSRSQIIALAGDLSYVTSIKTSHPRFANLARNEEVQGFKRCASARRAWLKKMGARSIVLPLIACVKGNARSLVPDPEHAHGSRYEEHAQWLRAVKEIDPDAFRKVMDRWRIQHKRRRNLWDALKRAGLT